MPDLQEVYGDIDTEMVKAKLGRPTIDFDNGRVDYCEQSFDDIHIFGFEFWMMSLKICSIFRLTVRIK